MIDEQKELLIQKCVDGELDVETQQLLLAQLDVVSEGWKILALAYVEEQAWSGSFAENNRIAQHLENEVFAQSMQSMVAAESQEVQCFMPPSAEEPDKKSRLLTQVTCLAIALVGGVLIGDVWRSRSVAGVSGIDVANSPENNPTTTQDGNLSNGSRPLMVDVPDQNGGTMRLPVYPLDQFNNQLQSEPELNKLADALWRSGYQLDEDQRWIDLELGDGRRALMPVNSWKVRPVGL